MYSYGKNKQIIILSLLYLMSAKVTVENLAQCVGRLDPGGVLVANLGHVIQVEERELSHFGFTSSLLDSFHTLKKVIKHRE